MLPWTIDPMPVLTGWTIGPSFARLDNWSHPIFDNCPTFITENDILRLYTLYNLLVKTFIVENIDFKNLDKL